jgi:hypothetical protein
MKARVIHTKYWTDSYIVSLNPNEKLLYIYYLTNENIGISGVYQVSTPFIQLSTGLTAEEIKQLNLKFEKDDKILFYEDWVCVVNSKKYQTYLGVLNELAELKELVNVPDLALKKFRYPLDTPTIVLEIRNKKLEIRNKKLETFKRMSTKGNETTADEVADDVARSLEEKSND